MNILSLDTSTEVAGIAFLEDERERFSHAFHHRMDLSQRLLPALQWLLRGAGLGLEDVNALAVGLGPGSFTGVRIGVTTAKVLAQVTGLPLVGIGTLEVMAGALAPCRGALVCPCIEARKHEVSTALYRMGPDGPEEMLPARALPAGEMAAQLAATAEPVMLCGTGAVRYRATFESALGEHLRYARGHDFPNPVVLAHLGHRRLQEGRQDDPLALVPLYARPSEAERALACR